VLGLYEINQPMYIQSNILSMNYSKYVFGLVRHNDNTLYVNIGKHNDNLQT